MSVQKGSPLPQESFSSDEASTKPDIGNRVGEFFLEKMVSVQCSLLSFAKNSEDQRIQQLGIEAYDLNIPPSSYLKGALEFMCWYVPTAFFNVKMSVNSVEYMFRDDKTAFGIAAALFHNFSYGIGLSAPLRAAWMTLYRKKSLAFGLCSMLPIWPMLFVASRLPEPYEKIALHYGIDWLKKLPSSSIKLISSTIGGIIRVDNNICIKTSSGIPNLISLIYMKR